VKTVVKTVSSRIGWKRWLVAGLAFGACIVVPTPRAAQLVDADLAVSLVGTADTVVVGQPVTYTATVVDNGPDQASGVSLSVILSGAKGSITATSSSTAGSVCTISSSRRSARCTLGVLAVRGSAQMTVTVASSGPGTLAASARARARQYDPIAANSLPQVQTRVTETDAPVTKTVYGSAFNNPVAPHRELSVRWSAFDTGSGVASFDVRYRAAPATGGFGPYVGWLTATAQRSATLVGKYGSTYCFSVRATDADGNTSSWTDERCTSVVLPTTAFGRSRGWSAVGAGGMRSRTTGSRLTLDGVEARRLVLSALVGPDYGRIRATWNGHPLRTIALRSDSRARRSFTLAEFPSLTRGTLVVTVISDRKTVAVYGLGVAKP
jgi:uncharacterized repeat protein (TIGR01451 family)